MSMYGAGIPPGAAGWTAERRVDPAGGLSAERHVDRAGGCRARQLFHTTYRKRERTLGLGV